MSEQLAFYRCDLSRSHRERSAQRHPEKVVDDGARGLPLTFHVLAIAKIFINNPPRWLCGQDLVNTLGLNEKTVYNTLYRMEAASWLNSTRYRDSDYADMRERTFYRITSSGHQHASQALLYLRTAAT